MTQSDQFAQTVTLSRSLTMQKLTLISLVLLVVHSSAMQLVVDPKARGENKKERKSSPLPSLSFLTVNRHFYVSAYYRSRQWREATALSLISQTFWIGGTRSLSLSLSL